MNDMDGFGWRLTKGVPFATAISGIGGAQIFQHVWRYVANIK
jgi:uncharacterized membrane protein YedE/YeeE